MSWKEWTIKEIQYVLDNYLTHRYKDIAKNLNRSETSVRNLAKKYGDKKANIEKNIYAFYRDDDLLAIGTASEVADTLGLKRDTIYYYASQPNHTKRNKVIKVNNEPEGFKNG